MSFIAELKRRNVIRTAVAYLAAAWLLIQVFESLLPVFGLPDTSIRFVFIALGIGFVPVMFAAWVFELTPDGLTRDSGDSRVDPTANRRFDRIIIAILVLAVTLFAAHTFIIDPARDAVQIEKAARDARTGAFKESFGAKSIAVLPFTNMSADPDQEYFGDGIAEELLNLLAKVEGLRVISRTSSFQFKNSGLSLAEIAEKLDVATVLEGSVRKSGNKLRITAQLIDAHADAHLWSETYDRTLEDVFEIQDEVAAKVVEQLKITLAAARHIEAAIAAEPRGYLGLLAAAALANSLGDLDLAIRIGKYMTVRDPMGFWGHANLGDAYLANGDTDKAISALRTAESISPKAGAIQ